MIRLLVVLAAGLIVTGCASTGRAGAGKIAGQTYRVSDLATLQDVLATKANPGDVVEIEPGTYYLSTPKISVQRSGALDHPIVIRGSMKNGVRPIIDASKVNVKRGVFSFEETTHDVILENVEICNAVSALREGEKFPANAAAAYILGANITLRNCRAHHCENGLFSTHESDFVLIDRCEIDHNGRAPGQGDPYRTHNFYFNSKHQMVKNCYIHHSTDSQNFKSRGTNNIFAFNWVEEELAYSIGLDSGNEKNTLWLGNVAIKRTYEGIFQGRLLGIGDGTGVAKGALVALNNTFITIFPRDFYLFTEKTSTCDAILINNVFAGPGKLFLEKNGSGSITGSNNWIASVAEGVPDTLKDTIRCDDPGFMDAKSFDFRLKPDSPLINSGVSPEEYGKAVRLVTANSRGDETAKPGVEWLKALAEIEAPVPAFEPFKNLSRVKPRILRGAIDIGALEAQ